MKGAQYLIGAAVMGAILAAGLLTCMLAGRLFTSPNEQPARQAEADRLFVTMRLVERIVELEGRCASLEAHPGVSEFRFKTLEYDTRRVAQVGFTNVHELRGPIETDRPDLSDYPMWPWPTGGQIPGQYVLWHSPGFAGQRPYATLLLHPDGQVERTDGEPDLTGQWSLGREGLMLDWQADRIVLDCAARDRTFLGGDHRRWWEWKLSPGRDDDDYAKWRQ